jgi:uncharacterized membrane protein
MAKKSGASKSIIGAVGGVLIGSAILLFVVSMILSSLKTAANPGLTHKLPAYSAGQNASAMARAADWNNTNATIDQLRTFMTICAILLGILGIVLIGSTIIGAIGGGFGG